MNCRARRAIVQIELLLDIECRASRVEQLRTVERGKSVERQALNCRAQFTRWGNAPRGPYIRPGDLARVGVPSPDELLDPLPEPTPPAAPILGQTRRHDAEAGPSRPQAYRDFPPGTGSVPLVCEPPLSSRQLSKAEIAAAMVDVDRVLADTMDFLNKGKAPAMDDRPTLRVTLKMIRSAIIGQAAGEGGGLKCGKSCRLRWINYLRPDIKRGKFSQEEEQTILNLHAILGNNAIFL
ncbi:uncharacterized protein LOC130994542 [Salvia miltiorrhiza]|uniref:uncharacterized protein LOC130994542 n=1 Tax=Salvia miltiorrhiza TaxID=226208 RepID=UPI0025ACBDDD|nr:uncharacterized protein LOC130994542 [Salvia miltiorrhiza]